MHITLMQRPRIRVKILSISARSITERYSIGDMNKHFPCRDGDIILGISVNDELSICGYSNVEQILGLWGWKTRGSVILILSHGYDSWRIPSPLALDAF